MRRKVVDSSLGNGVKSIFSKRHYPGYVWELTLECGHTVSRKVRYIGKRSGYRGQTRPVEEVAPAPASVECKQCDGKR